MPNVQLLPLSRLYSQVALGSSPVTVTVPLLVTPSVADVPVSVRRGKLGAVGAMVSMTIGLVFSPVMRLPLVCLTLIVPGLYVPIVRGKVVPVPVVQLAPLSLLYSQVVPASRLVSLTVTRLVIPSVLDMPESTATASSSTMVIIPTALFLAIVPLPAPVRATEKVPVGLLIVSPKIGTSMVLLVSPGLKNKVPLVAV